MATTPLFLASAGSIDSRSTFLDAEITRHEEHPLYPKLPAEHYPKRIVGEESLAWRSLSKSLRGIHDLPEAEARGILPERLPLRRICC